MWEVKFRASTVTGLLLVEVQKESQEEEEELWKQGTYLSVDNHSLPLGLNTISLSLSF